MTRLHSRLIGASADMAQARCLIVHGIMGSSQNWLGAARRLAKVFPTWSFRLLDLPGHGESTAVGVTPDLPSIAQAVHHELMEQAWMPTVLVGHSFGGKTMLELSKLLPKSSLDVWLLDAPMTADVTVTGTDTIEQILQVVETIQAPSTRAEVLAAFVEAGLAEGIGQWMTTNLRRHESGFVWKIDPSFIRPALADYLNREYWSELENKLTPHRFHCVLAGKSRWWRGMTERRLRLADAVKLHQLPSSGHWVHIDDLDGLVNCFKNVYALQ